MEKLKIVCVEPMKKAYVKEIDTGLEALQAELGGHIQMLYAFDDTAVIICNDDGKLLGLQPNRALCKTNGSIYDIVSGNFIVVDAPKNSENFGSLSDEQVEKYLAMYKPIQMVSMKNGKINVTVLNID